MKKLMLPIMASLFVVAGTTSCTKEPEVITETITITDTVSVSNSVAIYMEPFDQLDFGNGDFGMAELNYTVQNVGEQKVSSLKILFEAQTKDGSKYLGTDYHADLAINSDASSQLFITTADKECSSIKVKEIEITIN